MRRTVRPRYNEACAGIEYSGNAMDLCRLQSFFKGEGRQDRGHPLGQHGLARAWRPDHQDVVTSSAGDLNSALGGLLSAHILEVDEILLRLAQERVTVGFDGCDPVARVYEVNDVKERADR